jgi:hypothetical protein
MIYLGNVEDAVTAKQQALETISHLPENAGWADIEYQLHVLRKVRESEASEARGEIYTTEEARKRLLRRTKTSSGAGQR